MSTADATVTFVTLSGPVPHPGDTARGDPRKPGAGGMPEARRPVPHCRHRRTPRRQARPWRPGAI